MILHRYILFLTQHKKSFDMISYIKKNCQTIHSFIILPCLGNVWGNVTTLVIRPCWHVGKTPWADSMQNEWLIKLLWSFIFMSLRGLWSLDEANAFKITNQFKNPSYRTIDHMFAQAEGVHKSRVSRFINSKHDFS